MFTFRLRWINALNYRRLIQISDYIGYDPSSRLNVYKLNPVKAAKMGLKETEKILTDLNVYVPSKVKELIGELEEGKIDVYVGLENVDLTVYSDNKEFLKEAKAKNIIVWDKRAFSWKAKPSRFHELLKLAENMKLKVKASFKTNYYLSFSPKLKIKLRDYQEEAFKRWIDNGMKGIIVLPVASGKTIIGLKAIEYLKVKTLILVPTIDLLHQWRQNLIEKLSVPLEKVGVFGGGRREINEITVMTYDSAYINLDKYPTFFGLIIADECHHAVGPSYRKSFDLITAPYRLGLTATPFRSDGLHAYYGEILGNIVYSLSHRELQEEGYLAKHDEKRIYIELSEEEYKEYLKHINKYLEYCRKKLPKIKDPRRRFREVLKLAAKDPEAREALRAKNKARQIALSTEKKIKVVEEILERNSDEKIIIFSRYTDIVREVSKKFLIPRILHDTPKDERKEYLKLFREGKVRILATAMALDEGVDVPDASMAIIISGTGSHREYVQRLGRILRPKKKKAQLIELVTKRTIEPSLAKRRRKPTIYLEEEIR